MLCVVCFMLLCTDGKVMYKYYDGEVCIMRENGCTCITRESMHVEVWRY